MTRPTDESGVAVLWGVVLIGVLAMVMAVCLQVAGLVLAHRSAQAGADLAALAGAVALRDGGPACREAEDVAERNGTVLIGCDVHSGGVRVRVAVDKQGLLGFDRRLEARARAGPVEPRLPLG